MNGLTGRRALVAFAQLAATAVLSSLITVSALDIVTPEPAHTVERPAAVQRLYPMTVGTSPAVTYESHEAFVQDYLDLQADLQDLRQAIDYDASHGAVSPSLHEWADRRAPGTFGGGRKP